MKPRVLIVDDSLTVRMDLAESFEAAGFATELAATLGAARDALANDPFAVMVLDILLPDGDGIALLEEIRGAPSTVRLPVMLLSSEAEVRDRIRGLKTGADEYVGKPYDSAYVVSRARELVGKWESPERRVGVTTVLVIDDSATYRGEVRAALEGAGYAVIVAASGEEGLRTAADCRPGAIIIDGIMPGIDGATVVRRVRQDAALRRTPCILLTASDERDDELRGLDAGADAYVRKGDDVGLVLVRLAAILRASAATQSFDAPSGMLGPKKILAVDDSETYLNALADQLRQEGYDVALARSGEEALELLAVQSTDCILLDLIMPGLSGNETCRRIKRAPGLRDIPLVILTAREERETMIEGINAGADDYIAKSSDFEVLKARLRAQLRRKQFEDENRQIREELVRKEVDAAEARAAGKLAEARATLLSDLERKNAELAHANAELEAFSYSVSHDLRAPLRTIDGFSQAIIEDCADKLDARGLDHLRRVRAAAQRMGELIDDLLDLSRVVRAEVSFEKVDVSALARAVVDGLVAANPGRTVKVIIASGISALGDARLLRAALENLLGNVWKFTSKLPDATIEFGTKLENDGIVYYVKDSGVGFDMAFAQRLFHPFQRLHTTTEFEGTGIGLATVQRIVQRHGGRVWGESAVGKGATFYFTLAARAAVAT